MTVRAITNPDRLLTEHSITPYSVELRRRQGQFKAIAKLYGDMRQLLHDFEWNNLCLTNGIELSNMWEIYMSQHILCKFFELEDAIMSAVVKFGKSTYNDALHLKRYFGCNDAEYTKALRAEKEATRLDSVRYDFAIALRRLVDTNYDPNDDLPF